MKKEFKKIITIIKAAPQLKSQFFIALFLFAGGAFCEFSSNLGNTGILGIFACISTIYQSIMQSNGSSMVQSSAAAKKFQTLYPFIIQIPYNIIIFAILSWHRVYLADKPLNNMSATCNYATQCSLIILYSMLIFFSIIFQIISNRFFVIGIIFMSLSIVPIVISISFVGLRMQALLYRITSTNAVIIGYLIIIVGSLLSILLANLLYKYPISAHVMKANNKA
ncbi:MAG: hypothetical protein IKQ00_04750 [Butyrivibrio sp.]|nr:hypothetical protein [Butyrivibrio sp.]